MMTRRSGISDCHSQGTQHQDRRDGAAPWSFTAASPERRRALGLAQRIADVDCPVLIMGPTGVGKDVLAEDLHRHSRRAEGAFVAVNCAALATTLFESELFGHARGAYTSAVSPKPGLVELADNGTLFLDEVGELPLDAQVKLLRFLSKGTFWPVGAAKERSADVRIIAATNRDLPAMINGAFREDLFFRLSVVTIQVPPLEPADTRMLAREFAAGFSLLHATQATASELDAIADLAARSSWRGGAREVRNAIERLLLLHDADRSMDENWRDLGPLATPWQRPCSASGAAPAADPGAALQHIDDLVFLYLAQSAKDVRDLSQRFNRSLQTVYDRLKKLGIKPRDVGKGEILEQAMRRERAALVPHLPWIQELLKESQES